MRSSVIQRLLETYRTTTSGRKLAWDEPGESDSPEIRRHNTFLAKQLQRKRESKERLKSKGAVPTRDGKPIFEGSGNIQSVLMSFRRLYASNRPMRFREWIEAVAELLEDL